MGTLKIPCWEEFEIKFDREYPLFTRSLTERCNTLTRTELQICILIRLSMDSEAIGHSMNKARTTIEEHRCIIRRKLHLPKNANLCAMLHSLSSKHQENVILPEPLLSETL